MLPLYLPYYEQPRWEIGPLTIHAFGVLVAIALVVGTWVARWHGQTKGQNQTVVVDAATWTCISGFIVGHLVSVIFYFPERVVEDPLQLVYFWNGLSSFGGFLGAGLGLYIFLKRRGLPLLPYFETISVGLAPGWIIGRLGCTIAHDHPGRSTDFFLAFDHPVRGPIHDLGFYEFLFAIFLTILVFIVRRFKWPEGSIPAMMCMVYAPVRFMLDSLRVQDVKYSPVAIALETTGGVPQDPAPWWYLTFTPGQWFSIALFIVGIAVAVAARRRRDRLRAEAEKASKEDHADDSKSSKGDDGDEASDAEEAADDEDEKPSRGDAEEGGDDDEDAAGDDDEGGGDDDEDDDGDDEDSRSGDGSKS